MTEEQKKEDAVVFGEPPKEHLDINDIVFNRSAEGKVLPVEYESRLFKKIIKIRPMVLGEWRELLSKQDQNGNLSVETTEELILKHLVDPKLTKEDVKALKPKAAEWLFIDIAAASGWTKEGDDRPLAEKSQKSA